MNHDKHKQQNHTPRKFHKDWRLWVAVVLMLIGMAIYVITLDESIVPGEGGSSHAVPGFFPGTQSRAEQMPPLMFHQLRAIIAAFHPKNRSKLFGTGRGL